MGVYLDYPASVPYVATAKSFGDSTNYYQSGVGNFQATSGATGITQIMCLYPIETGQNLKPFYECTGGFVSGHMQMRRDSSGSTAEQIRTEFDITTGFSNRGPTLGVVDQYSVPLNTWTAFGFSFDVDTGAITVVHDGISTTSHYTHDIVTGEVLENLSGEDCKYGRPFSGVGHGTDHYMCHFWMIMQYIDLSNSTNWLKFFDADNKPIDLGSDGSGPGYGVPLHYAPDGDLSNNRGSMSNWTEVGTVPDAPSSPTD